MVTVRCGAAANVSAMLSSLPSVRRCSLPCSMWLSKRSNSCACMSRHRTSLAFSESLPSVSYRLFSANGSLMYVSSNSCACFLLALSFSRNKGSTNAASCGFVRSSFLLPMPCKPNTFLTWELMTPVSMASSTSFLANLMGCACNASASLSVRSRLTPFSFTVYGTRRVGPLVPLIGTLRYRTLGVAGPCASGPT